MINLIIGITLALIILVDYFIMKPKLIDVGFKYRLFSTIISIGNILIYFI